MEKVQVLWPMYIHKQTCTNKISHVNNFWNVHWNLSQIFLNINLSLNRLWVLLNIVNLNKLGGWNQLQKKVSLVKHKTVLVNKKQFTAMCSILRVFFSFFLKKIFSCKSKCRIKSSQQGMGYNLHSAQIIKVKFFHLIWGFFLQIKFSKIKSGVIFKIYISTTTNII